MDYHKVRHAFVNNLIEIKSTKETDTATLDKLLGEETEATDVYNRATSCFFHVPKQLLIVACSSGDFVVMDNKFSVLYSYNVSKQVSFYYARELY